MVPGVSYRFVCTCSTTACTCSDRVDLNEKLAEIGYDIGLNPMRYGVGKLSLADERKVWSELYPKQEAPPENRRERRRQAALARRGRGR